MIGIRRNSVNKPIVRSAISRLKEKGIPISNRSIRTEIGRGSLSTIQYFRKQIEAEDISNFVSFPDGTKSSSDRYNIQWLVDKVAELESEITRLREQPADTEDTSTTVSNDTKEHDKSISLLLTSLVQRWADKCTPERQDQARWKNACELYAEIKQIQLMLEKED